LPVQKLLPLHKQTGTGPVTEQKLEPPHVHPQRNFVARAAVLISSRLAVPKKFGFYFRNLTVWVAQFCLDDGVVFAVQSFTFNDANQGSRAKEHGLRCSWVLRDGLFQNIYDNGKCGI
jgi:hypothetical protein